MNIKTNPLKDLPRNIMSINLVYFDSTTDIKAAIAREKQIKGWTRNKKNALIESINPQWNDLSENWGK
ncbi:MAG: hypothetical protein P4L49_19555 [Desulfosporosinus sp.]|nr:hypothetical protein [Desulfosporosinus sp.]